MASKPLSATHQRVVISKVKTMVKTGSWRKAGTEFSQRRLRDPLLGAPERPETSRLEKPGAAQLQPPFFQRFRVEAFSRLLESQYNYHNLGSLSYFGLHDFPGRVFDTTKTSPKRLKLFLHPPRLQNVEDVLMLHLWNRLTDGASHLSQCQSFW